MTNHEYVSLKQCSVDYDQNSHITFDYVTYGWNYSENKSFSFLLGTPKTPSKTAVGPWAPLWEWLVYYIIMYTVQSIQVTDGMEIHPIVWDISLVFPST